MAELMRESVGLPWIGGWSGNDRSVALRHKLMLGMTGAMLGALLAGCAADKNPSKGETSLANAAKDVTIPLEAGKMKNPLPDTDDVASQGQEVSSWVLCPMPRCGCARKRGPRAQHEPACHGPDLIPRAALERRGTVLDHRERSSPHRHAFLEVEHFR